MTVLYIDDDPDDSDFAVEALHDLDDTIRCLTFSKASDAMEYLLTTDKLPAFIFLDINMPKMDGRECLEKIKAVERLKDIPIVMCSTTLQTSEMRTYFELGVYDFIVKPGSIGKLKEELSAIIESKRVKSPD